jgi:hypothetical protein
MNLIHNLARLGVIQGQRYSRIAIINNILIEVRIEILEILVEQQVVGLTEIGLEELVLRDKYLLVR